MWKAFKATAGVLLALIVLPLVLAIGGCLLIGVGANAARDARLKVQKAAVQYQETPHGEDNR